jgi:transposase
MMGRHNRDQEQLFYSFCLDEVVPDDHLVRAIAAVLDLSWVYGELASYYPKIGRPSIDPVLMIRSSLSATCLQSARSGRCAVRCE